jgi:GT2 family glycosyltransferase
MIDFWDSAIEPILRGLQPRTIVTIGAGLAAVRRLLGWCEANGASVHSIEPIPLYPDPAWEKEFPSRVSRHRGPSVEVLRRLGPFDLVLADDEPNWHTTFGLLHTIEERCLRQPFPFPVVLVSGIGWPYGRRDRYSHPGAIPAEDRQPMRRGGLRPGSTAVLDRGGLNPHFYHALQEGGPRNGVLTAVEDFLSQARHQLEMSTTPGFHGLAVLARQALQTENALAWRILRNLDPTSSLRRHLEGLEARRLEELLFRVEAVRSQAQGIPGHPECSAAEDRPAATGPNDSAAPIQVSVVIPVFNQLSYTRACLEALLRNTPEAAVSYEIVVVDDASSDETPAYLKEALREVPNLVALRNEVNQGFSRTCNRGAAAARGEFVLFLNNDTEVQPGWLQPLYDLMRGDPRIGATGSRTTTLDGVVNGCDGYFVQSANPRPYPVLMFAGGERRLWPTICSVLLGACLMVRTRVFREMGGFDEGFRNGGEDIDLCMRLMATGRLVVYQPDSLVIHHMYKSGPERFRYGDRNTQQMVLKWSGQFPLSAIQLPDGRIRITDLEFPRRYVSPAGDKGEAGEG